MRNKHAIKTQCSACPGEIEPHRLGMSRYCLACHAKWMRENRPKYKELSQRQKMKARACAGLYERRYGLEKKPCACGSTDVERHHEDYSKPLEVVYMCRLCHFSHHTKKSFRKVLQITNLKEEKEKLLNDELDRILALNLDGW